MAKILVMEDEAEFAFHLSDILSLHEHEMVWCRTATEAREALEDQRFDLLISDIYIYKGGKIVSDGGLALIGWIRNAVFSKEYAWLQGFPVIAISGATKLPGNQNILQVAQSVGANYALAKPITDQALLETLDQALGGAGD